MPSFSDKVINDLRAQLEINKPLSDQLTKSLNDAATNAKGKLNSDLYTALKWPTEIEKTISEYDYIDYLTDFARWIPKQASEPPWSGQKEESREVLDRLCHFYWLIDQPDSTNKVIVENHEWFREWLIDYADSWGSFLDTTESFNHDTLDSFINYSEKYRVQDSMIGTKPHWRPNAPSGWLTFNQFFARELNGGLRPIDQPNDNQCVTSPADCSFKQYFMIDKDSRVDNINLKGTTTVATVKDLLGEEYSKTFQNGVFVHYFLSPFSYHHFHAPVAGEVMDCFPVRQEVYLDVTIAANGQFDAPDTSETGYEFKQSRGILVIDTSVKNPHDNNSDYGNIGKVAVVPVGMAQVSSVSMTATKGQYLQKGDEFGYFTFGGSNIIMLFEEGRINNVEKDIFQGPVNPPTPDPKYFHYGNQSVQCKKFS